VSDDLSIPNPGYRGNRAGRYGMGLGRIRQGMDPDTRRLVMFAGGLGVVLVGLIGASTLIGHHSTEVPVVAADGRPVRVKPGMKIDGAENDVFSGGSDTADARLAPPSENPDTKALRTAEAPPAPVVAMPAPTVLAPSPPAAKPAVAAIAPPAERSAAPAATVVAAPAAKVAVAPPAKPAAAKPPASVVAAHAPASGHPALVQLGAFTSEEAARSEWQHMSKRMPDLLKGRQPVFSRYEREGHTYWRVRTSGFADVTQARTFCEHVHAKGGGCSVAEF
jgi:hypothetical protein